MIFYESMYRLADTLNLMLEVFGNRKIAIVREISKLHEEIIRDHIKNIIENIENVKGEIVIVVDGYKESKKEIINDYNNLINELIKSGYSKRDAIKEIADKYNVSKNKLYNEFK